MKKNNSISIMSVVVGLISVVWIICVLLLSNIDGPEFFLWSGFIFAVIDFALAFFGMTYFAQRVKQIEVEISIMPCWFVGIFFIASISLNAVLAFLYDGNPNKMAIVMNLLLYAIYGSIILYANSYVKQMVVLKSKIEARTSANDNYRLKVSMIIETAKTPAVKNNIQKLKDLIDYSSGIAGGWADKNEIMFQNKLNEIELLIAQNEPDEVIIAHVQQAIEIWKCRNVIVTNK